MPQTVYDHDRTFKSGTFQRRTLTLFDLRSGSGRAAPGRTGPGKAGLGRWIARKWDLLGVLALMASCATYALFSLTHLGL